MRSTVVVVVVGMGLLLGALWPRPAHANPLDHLRTQDVGLHKVPHLGESHILVIPTRVGEQFPAGDLQQLRRYFAAQGGADTFRDYWRTNSNGRYDPIPTVVDPVIYLDRCPVPGKTLSNCTLGFDDVALLFTGGLKATFEDLLVKLRDEQALDYAEFDVNGPDGVADGYFDGIIVDSDLWNGVGFPLAALNNTATVAATTAGGAMLSCGIVALVPPNNHEFGHLLGFIDLYGGPALNDLMEDTQSTLAAFSRQQVGWGPVVRVNGPGAYALRPSLQDGMLLRFGDGPRYVMMEYRGGPVHARYDVTEPGVYVYAVDETQLPTEALGFLDLTTQTLYLPNETAPYLDVVMPVGCSLGTLVTPGDCALTAAQESRTLIHANGDHAGFSVIRGPNEADGTVVVYVAEGDTPPAWPPPATSIIREPPPMSSSSSTSGGRASSRAGSSGTAVSSPGESSGGVSMAGSSAGSRGAVVGGCDACLMRGAAGWPAALWLLASLAVLLGRQQRRARG